MHLYLRIALLLTITLMVKYSEGLDGLSHRRYPTRKTPIEVEETSQDHAALRDERRIKDKKGARLNWGIIDSLIDFSSGSCTGTAEKCMSQKDCKNMGGTSTDTCVQGFGVCCDTCSTDKDYTGGSVTIGECGGWFFNKPGKIRPYVFDDPQSTTQFSTIPATLLPPKDAVQIKIFIESMHLLGPNEGDCNNDTLVINGANPKLKIPELCGVASNQTLYIDIDNSEGPYNIEAKLAYCIIEEYSDIDSACVADLPEWRIRVDFLTEADAVPRRCLQYHTAITGKIESFNYQLDPPGMMLNDQTYSICFGYVAGFCDIAFNVERFDLGLPFGECTDDYVLVGDEKQCGDVIDYSITANATGPIIIGVRAGSGNELEEEGFSATYTMLGC